MGDPNKGVLEWKSEYPDRFYYCLPLMFKHVISMVKKSKYKGEVTLTISDSQHFAMIQAGRITSAVAALRVYKGITLR